MTQERKKFYTENREKGGIFMYAKVIVEIPTKAVDKLFVYHIPDHCSEIKVGARVKVPFAHQKLEGFVLSLADQIEAPYEIKDIIALVDEEPVLTKEMLFLGNALSQQILCTKIAIYQAMLPKALKASNKTEIKKKMTSYLTLSISKEETIKYLQNCPYPKQKEILEILLKNEQYLISKKTSSINTLLKKNICKIIQKEEYRYSYQTTKHDTLISLNQDQQNAVNRVLNAINQEKVFLLYGITGSGKTEVYMNIIEKMIQQGKTAIMLVPEISLTPQIVERFTLRFGQDVAILHSGLSDTEKYDEYRKIQKGEVHIAIGARSAIFAPLTNLGVIIIDEEHSSTYKQDNNPRYHARDVAILRGKYHHAPVVLGSATPSLESMARAQNKVYELITLLNRAGKGTLPLVHIVNMKEEPHAHSTIFSSLLLTKIKEKLSKHEQIILFLNRRGYSSISTCLSCGESIKCPNCDISLTYHKTSGMLRCHYCGFAMKKVEICPHCQSTKLSYLGLGTEKVEEELIHLFPQNKVVRMDMDTTSKKGAHQKIIDAFSRQQYDILVGTQMIAKGLDFPKVTLVGVINADASLNIPDYRSSERTFQLLCQVSGRAGRGEAKGEVIIQTLNPNHYSIAYAKKHDYISFYKEEMKMRKQLNYSPYYYIILIRLKTKDYELSFQEAKKVGEYLRKNLSPGTYLLGPAMANVFRVDNVYYQQCIIKYQKDEKIIPTLIALDNHYKTNHKVTLEIDRNPNHL